MKIHSGHGTPVWLALRDNGGLVTAQGTSHIQLSVMELQKYVDAIHELTGIKAGRQASGSQCAHSSAERINK